MGLARFTRVKHRNPLTGQRSRSLAAAHGGTEEGGCRKGTAAQPGEFQNLAGKPRTRPSAWCPTCQGLGFGGEGRCVQTVGGSGDQRAALRPFHWSLSVVSTENLLFLIGTFSFLELKNATTP